MFTVIHDLADHGVGVGNLYQIETGRLRSGDGIRQRYYAYLLSVGADEPDCTSRTRIDFIINRRPLTLNVFSLDRLIPR